MPLSGVENWEGKQEAERQSDFLLYSFILEQLYFTLCPLHKPTPLAFIEDLDLCYKAD